MLQLNVSFIMGVLTGILAEFLGSTFIAAFTFLSRSSFANDWSSIAVAHFLVYASLTYAFYKTSGSMFNPVLTGILMLSRSINSIKAIISIIAQIIGSLLGAGLATMIWNSSIKAEKDHLLYPKMDSKALLSAAILEGVGMMMVCLTYFCCLINLRGPKFVSGAAIGGAYLTFKAAFGPKSGGAFNFTEILGPTLFHSVSLNDWPYYGIGHIVGSVCAWAAWEGFLKDYGKSRMDDEEEEEPATEMGEPDSDNTIGVKEKAE